MSSWESDIVEAFGNLGGVASYDELHNEIKKIRKNLSGEWTATLRSSIQNFSSDSDSYTKGKDLFYSVNGKGSGVWGLRRSKNIEPGEILTNNQLMASYVIGQSGGMRRSKSKNSLVIISDATKSLYDDRWVSDNILHYTGMGTSGNQDLNYAQNKTLANSLTNGVTVCLYEVFTQNNYIFVGEVSLCGEPYQENQVGEDGKNRLVYMYPLKLNKDGVKPLPTEKQLDSISTIRKNKLDKKTLEELKLRAGVAPKLPSRREAKTEVIIRNDAVVEYVKYLAKGVCDLCDKDAPFKKNNGESYLECHHIIRLADDGEDSIENAVALCPNCHRKMHSLNLRNDVTKLIKKVSDR